QCKTPVQGGCVAALDRSFHVEIIGHCGSSAVIGGPPSWRRPRGVISNGRADLYCKARLFIGTDCLDSRHCLSSALMSIKRFEKWAFRHLSAMASCGKVAQHPLKFS